MRILTAKETALFLRISRATLYRHIQNHSLPHMHLGRRLLFREDELMRWLDQHQAGGSHHEA